MKLKENTHRRRRCHHSLRYRYRKVRHALRSGPAMLSQIWEVMAKAFGIQRRPTAPMISTSYVPPQWSPSTIRRQELARQLRVPVRYAEIVLSLGQVPYRILFDHIRRGGALRRDAMIELRKRAPEVSLDWLAHVEKWGLWSELSRCNVIDAEDEYIELRLLEATAHWLELEHDPGVRPDTKLSP